MNIIGPDGKVVRVTESGKMEVLAVSQSLPEALNIGGVIFVTHASVTPAGADDYFFYLKNTGTVDIAISEVSLVSTVPTRIEVREVTGTPSYVSEQNAPVVNLNLGSSNSPTIESKFDTNITGLTEGGLLVFEECAVADVRYSRNVSSGLIIPQGKAVGFKRIAATGLIDISIGFGQFGLSV